MKALALLMFLIGVLAMLFLERPSGARRALQDRTVAMNFVIYRNAVHKHVFSSNATGVISTNDLDLPEGWQAMRDWNARVADNRCLVWGEATAEEVSEVRRLLRGSWAVGTAVSGSLYPGHNATVAVPGVPEGNLVSVVNVE